MDLYARLLRPLLFQIDPETAHRGALALGAAAGFASPALRSLLAVSDPRLKTRVAGLDFPTPIGLAAGFDKNGQAVAAMAGLGFGFIEIGSISASFSPGNARPRLFRLPQDRAIAVAYGVPNDGAKAVAARLKDVRLPVPLGINIVTTNHGPGSPPESDDAIIADYMAAAQVLAPCADYLMFNLSCPNTSDGKDFFADRVRLDAWLTALAAELLTIPIFLKVSPLGGVAHLHSRLHVQPAAGEAGAAYDNAARTLDENARCRVRPAVCAAARYVFARMLSPHGPDALRAVCIGWCLERRRRLSKDARGRIAGVDVYGVDLRRTFGRAARHTRTGPVAGARWRQKRHRRGRHRHPLKRSQFCLRCLSIVYASRRHPGSDAVRRLLQARRLP
jgi:hypothetical protein